MRILILGAPGAGKGTQATFIKEEFNIPHISTGDIFRENLRNETELGLKAKSYMNEGKLVPDDLTIELVKDRLSWEDAKNGFLLDGFPRNLNQAESLTKFLDEAGVRLDAVVDIETDKDALVKRICGRRMCKDCGASFHVEFNPPKQEGVCDHCGGELYTRDDDNEETVLKRIGVYEKETSPLIEYYDRFGIVLKIDGNRSVDEVKASIIDGLKGKNDR
ncbi:MAG: adenylate kinase [Ezakiella sp.]|nr:adenylate kinase [Ezakiella sp.]MDD7761237.1 adenylate kinase [Bacillota bacterium]MDY3947592.1 adenylate kinase [Ezakiella sp.]